MRYSIVLLLALLSTLRAAAQERDTVRVCTYNLHRFDLDPRGVNRIDELRRILDEIGPEILVVQDLAGRVAFTLFADSVAAKLAVPLQGAEVMGERQTEYVAIFYDPLLFAAGIPDMIADSPRVMAALPLAHRASGDSLIVIGAQWEQGREIAPMMKRLESGALVNAYVTRLRRESPATRKILFAGTLNLYTSDEPGYRSLLIEERDATLLVDPVDRPGDWHDNPLFADLHTNDPKVTVSLMSGVTGGLSDRFDQILLSDRLGAGYIPGSYTVVGNDGAHFNDSITAQPNHAVSPETAKALVTVSDHLPVYLDLVVGGVVSDVREEERKRVWWLDLF